jgi:spore maturation protein CgeB
MAKLFDHVFLYQRNYVSQFRDHGDGAVHWLPYACDTELFYDRGTPRDLDVGMIGRSLGARSERDQTMAILCSRYRVNEQRYYYQNEITDLYSRAKIVVNIPIGDDLNFRFFEALSCGALLCTRRLANGQEDLFTEGVHYVGFDTQDELLDTIDRYLNDEESRAAIARSGYVAVRHGHTLAERLTTLLRTIADGPRHAAPVRQMTAAAVIGLYAETWEHTGRIEPILALAAEAPSWIDRARLTALGARAFLRRSVRRW